MHKPIDIIEAHAVAITRSMDIMVYSLEGLYEKTVRDNPSPAGIRDFWMVASEMSDENLTIILGKIEEALASLYASLSDSERVHFNQHDDYTNDSDVAQATFGALFTQAKIAYTKRLRDIVAARAFGVDTYQANPKMMTRNGRRWDFSEYTYLSVRQIMIDWYNGIKIGYLVEQGVDTFTLDTEDPDLMYQTYLVEDYPTLAQELFHPRTSKLVGGAYVSS